MARVGSKGQVRSTATRSKTRNKICRLGRVGGVGSKGQVGSRETRSKTRNKICRLGKVGGVGRVQAGRQQGSGRE